MRSLRYLPSLLLLLALLTVAVGFMEMLFSPAPLPGDTGAAPTVDSNYRFFAAIFLAVGLLLLRVSLDPLERARGLALWWVFRSGVPRRTGPDRVPAPGRAPAPLVYALPAIEPVAPPVLVLWHRALTRASDTATSWPGTASADRGRIRG